jgi:hypothetical protein
VANDRIRVEIGFAGGHVMNALVDSESIDRLELALGGGGGPSVALNADDGSYTLAVAKIVYVKRFARESRVGFGAG